MGIEISGLGEVQEDFVVIRRTGQSYACREKRASLTIVNDSDSDIAFVRLDGGISPNGDVCDYSISMRDVPRGFILELKGRDIHHAVEQLCKTLRKLSFHYAKAIVVSSGAQKIPTGEWQKVQKTFFSSNQVPLGRFPNNAHVPFLAVIA